MIQPPRHDPNREVKTMYDFRNPKHLLGDPTEDCPRVDLSKCIVLDEPPSSIRAVHTQFSKLQTLLRGDLYIKRGGDNVASDTQVGREFELRLWWFLKNVCRLEVTEPDLTLFVAGSEYEPDPIVDGGKKIQGLMEEEARKKLTQAIGEPIFPQIKIDVINSPSSAWMGDLIVQFDDCSVAVHCKTTTDDTIDRTYGRPSVTVGRGARSKGADPHILRFPSNEILAFGIQRRSGTMLLAYFESWATASQIPSVPVQDSLIGEKVCFYLDDLVGMDPSTYPPSPDLIKSLLGSIKRDIVKTREEALERETDRMLSLSEKLRDASEDQRKQILREMKFADDDPALK